MKLPDDGMINTVQYGEHKHEVLKLQLGNNLCVLSDIAEMDEAEPAAPNSHPTVPTPPASRVRRKRARVQDLCVTIWFDVPPNEQEERKEIRDLQQHHTRTVLQVETALKNAKKALDALYEDAHSNDDDIYAGGLECRALTVKLQQLREKQSLKHRHQTVTKTYVVPANVPTELMGMAERLVVTLTNVDVVVQDAGTDVVNVTYQEVPLHIEGEMVQEIKLDYVPGHMAYSDGKVFITHNRQAEEGQWVSIYDSKTTELLREWKVLPEHEPSRLTGIDVYDGKMYLSDGHNGKVRVFDLETQQQCYFFGIKGNGTSNLEDNWSVAIAEGRIYICDVGNKRIQVFGLDGTWLRSFGSYGVGESKFVCPRGIAVYDKEVYVVDSSNNCVQVFDLEGKLCRKWGEKGYGNLFNFPTDIVVHNNLVYVTDRYNNRVQLFNAKNGTLVGSCGTRRLAHGDVEEIIWPLGCCMDNQDRLWVCNDSFFSTKRIWLFQ